MLISLIGVALAFAVILCLAARGVHLALSLSTGTIVAGLFLPFGVVEFLKIVLFEVFSSSALQLAGSVALIGGLGRIMKSSGQLDLIVQSLTSLLGSDKFLCMVIPALFGSLNVYGGAILSAPLMEESGQRLNLSKSRLSAVNIFYRHAFTTVYPLYPSVILFSELIGLDRLVIIRNNALILIPGLLVANFVFFRQTASPQVKKTERTRTGADFKNLCIGFSPVLVMLFGVICFRLPLFLASILGVALSLFRLKTKSDGQKSWLALLSEFFRQCVDYKIGLLTLAIMAFNGVIQSSGVVSTVLGSVIDNGVPLALLLVTAGPLIGYALGAHQAATGLLAPIFAPLLPRQSFSAYATLLYISMLLGYLLSPIHLCLTLSNHYYGADLWEVYKDLLWPPLAMLVIALLWVLI